MRAFRYAFGIFVLEFGVLGALGTWRAHAQNTNGLPFWIYFISFCLIGLGPILGGLFLLRSFLRIPPPACPKCGSNNYARTGVLRKSPFLRLWLFGWFGLLRSVWLGGTAKRLRCQDCDETFGADTRGAALARIVLYFIVVFFVFCILIDLLADSSR